MAILFPVKLEMAILFLVKHDLDPPPFTTLNGGWFGHAGTLFCFILCLLSDVPSPSPDPPLKTIWPALQYKILLYFKPDSMIIRLL